MTTNVIPWNRVGTSLNTDSIKEAIKEGGLDWQVNKVQLQSSNGHVSTEFFGIERNDTRELLGVVKKRYEVFQNLEAFEFLDEVIEEEEMSYDSIGSIDEGKKVWVSVKMKDAINIGGKDTLYPYLMIITSHDGTTSTTVLPTTLRLACSNMLNSMMRSQDAYRIRHVRNIRSRINELKASLSCINKDFALFEEKANVLVDTQWSHKTVSSFFEKLFPDNKDAKSNVRAENMRESLLHYFNMQNNRVNGIGGTAWAAVNAVTEFIDHDRNSRGKNLAQRENNRFKSILLGSGSQIKNRAMQLALAHN